MTSNLAHLLGDRARRLGGKRVFSHLRFSDRGAHETSVTYAQLHDRAMAIGAELQSRCDLGQRALLLFPPGLDFIPAFFGSLYAGVIAVPASPAHRKRGCSSLQEIVKASRPSVVLSTTRHIEQAERLYSHIPDLMQLPWLATDGVDDARKQDWTDPDLDRSQLAFLQYTSGSTAAPKGVMLTHDNLLQNSALIQESFGATEESKSVFWLPLHHDMGLIGGILQPIYCGGSSTLFAPAALLHRPLHWLQTIARTQATISGGPNFAYDLCCRKISEAEREGLDLSSWNLAFVGAEPIRAETLSRFAETFGDNGFRSESFFPCYGLAEATLIVSGGPRSAAPIVAEVDAGSLEVNEVRPPSESNTTRQLVASGETLSGQELAIVEPTDRTRCSDGQVGEIWVRGASVAMGYFECAEATEATFRGELADSGDARFLRTGDLGYLQDGQLFVTGRLKDVIIIRGRNYYPQDIEQVVEVAHEGFRVGFCAAFSVDVANQERLVIVQEVEPRQRDLDVEAALRSIRHSVADHFELETFGIVLAKAGQIPKTTSGKTRRVDCRNWHLQDRLKTIAKWQADPDANGAEPQVESDGARTVTADEIEKWLSEQIATRLGTTAARISSDTPFLEFGMGSLEAVEMTAELERWLGRKLSPTAVYNHPNISALSRWLATPTKTVADDLQTSPVVETHDPVELLNEVQQLSDQEIESLIVREAASRNQN